MAYQIQYNASGKARWRQIKIKKSRKVLPAILAVGGVLLLVYSWHGDWTVTANALETMAGALSQGIDLQDAFFAFCTEILQGA